MHTDVWYKTSLTLFALPVLCFPLVVHTSDSTSPRCPVGRKLLYLLSSECPDLVGPGNRGGLQLVGVRLGYPYGPTGQKMEVLTWGVVFRGCRGGQSGAAR